jgi:predicted nucleic acid-binding protein
MPFVLDASITAAWAFDDEDHPLARLALDRVRDDQARVPAIWWFEVRNMLIVNERRGRINAPDTASLLATLAQLDIAVDALPADADLLALARLHRLTVYDASYLELARRTGLPLATLDKDLQKAAPATGVTLFGARGRR